MVGAKELELINTDIQPTWREYSEALGFKFAVHDIKQGGLEETCGLKAGELDYVIVSCMPECGARTWKAAQMSAAPKAAAHAPGPHGRDRRVHLRCQDQGRQAARGDVRG